MYINSVTGCDNDANVTNNKTPVRNTPPAMYNNNSRIHSCFIFFISLSECSMLDFGECSMLDFGECSMLVGTGLILDGLGRGLYVYKYLQQTELYFKHDFDRR